MISVGKGGGASVDPNPTLLAEKAQAIVDRDAALASLASTQALLAAAQDLSVRVPTSWTTRSWRWVSNPTIAAFPTVQHDTAVPGLSTFVEGSDTCLKCVVGSTQATISSGKRAEGVFNGTVWAIGSGARLRYKVDVRFDLAGGKWVSNSNWAVVTQVHGFLSSGSPPVSIEIHGDEIRIRVMPDFHDQRGQSSSNLAGGVVWVGSVAAFASAWVTFEITVQFGLDPNSAWIQVNLNGTSVVARTFMQNMLFDTLDTGYTGTSALATTDGSFAFVGAASPGFLKMGLYQNPTIATRECHYRRMEVDLLTPVYT